MNYKYFIALGGAAALLPACAPKQAAHYNVLFLMADDMKPAMACYGDTIAITPALDGLAKDGILYSRAYCQQAVSGPSRASLLTGMYPDQTGVLSLNTWIRKKNPDIVTLPQAFWEAGYVTASAGKVFHGAKNNLDGLSWSLPPLFYEQIRSEAYILEEDKTDYKSVSNEFTTLDESLYYDVQIRQAALSRLDSLASGDKPFFFAVGFHKPHLPWCAPQRFLDMYLPRQLSIDTARVAGAPFQAYRSNRELIEYNDVPSDGPIPMEQQEYLKKCYYACSSFTDENIACILRRLKDLGLYDNTLIVFLGDHGYHHGEQGLWCKSTEFESSCNAPLIIKLPKGMKDRKARALADVPVSFVDIMPTLCEVCGVPAPEHLSGENLLGGSHGPYAFSQIAHSHGGVKYTGYTVRDLRWTYTEWLTPGLECAAAELYDMDGRDSLRYEKQNVLSQYPEKASALSKALHDHLDTVLGSGR